MTKSTLSLRLFTVLSMLLWATFSSTVHARQLDDVNFPDKITIDGSDTPLQLNGMGYRTKFVFKIYIGGLYTESKVNSREEAQALKGPKRVVMHMVYDEVSREKMAKAWREGFEDNNSDEQLAKLQTRLDTLASYFPDLKAGNVVLLDYDPTQGTCITINGEKKGVIEGADFYVALLDVWLGDDPADDELKDAMLGIEEEE